MKYRILQDNYDGYYLQRKRWWGWENVSTRYYGEWWLERFPTIKAAELYVANLKKNSSYPHVIKEIV